MSEVVVSRPQGPSDTSLQETSAGSTDATLSLLTQLLPEATSCIDAAVFELLGGRARTGGVHMNAVRARPSFDELVPFVLADARCHAGPPDCFSLDRPHGRHVFGLRFSDQGITLAAGYVVFAAGPAPHELGAVRALCELGTRLLAGARSQQSRRLSEANTQAFQSRMGAALFLGAEAYWEADASSIVRRVVQLSPAQEAQRATKLEGRNLRSLLNEPGALDGNEFRNVPLKIVGSDESARSMELSGRLLPDGTWHGIVRIVRSHRDGPSTVQHARSLLDMVQSSREQESAAHQETEIILDGLRILTSGRPDRELLRSLLDLLGPAIEFQDSVVLKRDWSGRIAAHAGTAQPLLDADWQVAGENLFAIGEVAAILRIPQDIVIPDAAGAGNYVSGSALAIKLRGGSRATVLLCLHKRGDAFGARHVGLGMRLSLVASQAFMNEDERQKVIDASKLATIGELAAGIIHEIRQPLTVMTLAVNNLLGAAEAGHGLDPQKLVAKLDKLKVQIERVTKIITTMRVLARHSDGTREPFGVADGVREASGLIQHKLTGDAVRLDVDIAEDLRAQGNALEFGQVILNLLSNAHDAIMTRAQTMKSGSAGARCIAVSARAIDAQWLEIVVRDTGCGFPKSEAERAFEPFFTTKEPGKGTGLGLALCRRIVENMQGAITLGNWAEGAEIRLRLQRS